MDRLKDVIYWKWHVFWYRFVYKSKRIGNYEKRINRFTGEHRVVMLHPLARVGINLTQQQCDFINELLGEEKHLESQELILHEIQKQLNFDGFAEAFIMVAHELEREEDRLEREEIEAWIG